MCTLLELFVYQSSYLSTLVGAERKMVGTVNGISLRIKDNNFGFAVIKMLSGNCQVGPCQYPLRYIHNIQYIFCTAGEIQYKHVPSYIRFTCRHIKYYAYI